MEHYNLNIKGVGEIVHDYKEKTGRLALARGIPTLPFLDWTHKKFGDAV